MPELSKTAKASTVKAVKEVVVETPEEAIRQIRWERQAHIWPRTDRIDKLLAAYDKLLFANGELTKALNEETSKVLTLQADQNKIREYDALKSEGLSDHEARETIWPALQMATIPAQEEDEHHLVDFGHDNRHSHPEGA